MIISVPASLKVASLNWQCERFDTRFEGLAGTFQTSTVPGARWRCTLNLPTMQREQAGAVEAFLMRVSDLGNRFHMERHDRPLMGAGGGTPVVYGGGQTGRSIMTDGWPAGAVILRAGDMIQLGPNRLHMVTADVTSSPGGILFDENGDPLLTEDSPPQQIQVDGAGRASIPIEPPLQSSPAANAPVQIGTNAKAVFMLDTGYVATSTPGIFTCISVEVVQDLAWSA